MTDFATYKPVFLPEVNTIVYKLEIISYSKLLCDVFDSMVKSVDLIII